MNDLTFLIPIVLFVCITYAIKAVVDARVRKQLVASNVSQELIQSIVEADEQRRRHSTLRWGAILIILAIGFGLWRLNEPYDSEARVALSAIDSLTSESVKDARHADEVARAYASVVKQIAEGDRVRPLTHAASSAT